MKIKVLIYNKSASATIHEEIDELEPSAIPQRGAALKQDEIQRAREKARKVASRVFGLNESFPIEVAVYDRHGRISQVIQVTNPVGRPRDTSRRETAPTGAVAIGKGGGRFKM